MKHRATSLALFAFACLALSTAVSPADASRRPLRTMPSGDEPPSAGSNLTSPWQGGPCSLPYNIDLTEPQVRDHALQMTGVIEAMNSFQARGYIRRADFDTFYTGTGYSGLVLGYEKPGVPVLEKQPVIVIQTQAISFAGEGWFPATTIGGFLAADSVINDTLTIPIVDKSLADKPMLVYQQVELAGVGAPIGVESFDGKAGFYAYSAREVYNAAQHARRYLPKQSPEAAEWWYGLGNAMAAGAYGGIVLGGLNGSLAGLAGVPPGMALGFLQGTVGGATGYVATHPFPNSNPNP